MRIPKRYQGKGLDNFVGFDRDIIEAKDALEHGESIFITGACGSGKTHLALGLLLEWLAWRWDGRNLRFNATFVSWVELLLQLKNGFNEGQSELSMIEPYTTLDLLVLDDLGAEKVSDWSREGCYVILDRRYRDMRQTIVTSNLNLGQISHNLDDRIASRLVEMAKVIKLEGTDYRLKKTEMAIFEAAVVRKRE